MPQEAMQPVDDVALPPGILGEVGFGNDQMGQEVGAQDLEKLEKVRERIPLREILRIRSATP